MRSFLGLVVLLFSAGEELLDDADTQSVAELDSAEGKEQHDTCVRGQLLSKWKWKLSKWLSLHLHFSVTSVKILCFH